MFCKYFYFKSCTSISALIILTGHEFIRLPRINNLNKTWYFKIKAPDVTS